MVKNSYDKLQKKLVDSKQSSWLTYSQKDKKNVFSLAEDYKKFLTKAKTERLTTIEVIKNLKKAGFKNLESTRIIKSGDKVYKVFKEKAIVAFVAGKNISDLRIIGSHMDSPRLDLKPQPLYEDSNLALLKSHYYGGIKKYHWVNNPLALHGVIFTKKGKQITISIGEKDNEPKFIIPDLLPHLAQEQYKKPAPKIIEGEDLNIVVGNIPVSDTNIKESIKLAVLEHLNKEYGLVEEDFFTAELELVPAGKPFDIGFDKSLIGAYGQDDGVCVFTSLKAILEINKPSSTAIALFVDKEEIGSTGGTGAEGFILRNSLIQFLEKTSCKENVDTVLEKAKALSADVTAGVNPNHKEVHDLNNASYLGKGVSIEKYGGSRGKYGTNDANAEYMNEIRMLCARHKVKWQTGELGKIDIGGGGTIAMFMSRHGMDTVDAGPCVLGMHSPYEITSKADIYEAYKLYKAFFSN